MPLQAEIAGRTPPSADGYLAEGHMIRDFCMCSSEGQEVLLSRYRGHSNMVLGFAGESDSAAELLSELRRVSGIWQRTKPGFWPTDRFGEVFAAYKAGQGKSLPSVEEISGWIDFINSQCPECGPLEWPD